MKYIGKVYRPPSEWRSLIVQATVGCSHNDCGFCTMYKEDTFYPQREEVLFKGLEDESKNYNGYEKVFLADGNALCLSTFRLLRIINKINELFPNVKRVSSYARASDVLAKDKKELEMLKEAGLELLYMGMESGSDKILDKLNKGENSSQYIEAVKLLKEVGIKTSVTLILGIGGKEDSEEHALESAKLISQISPEYLSFLTLYLEPNAPLLKEVEKGNLTLLNPKEILEELKLFLQEVNCGPTVFRCNHASNYAPLAGDLPQDKEKLIASIDKTLGTENYRPEEFRRL